MIGWFRGLFSRLFSPRFRPQVVYYPSLNMTDILLRDTATVSVPWGYADDGAGHVLDMLYDLQGDLVGVRMWADVRRRADLVRKT